MEPKPPKTLADFEGFVPLDPEAALALIAKQKDVLTGAAKAQNERLQGHTCPHCGRAVEVTLHPHPFTSNRPLARYVGRCTSCKVEGILIDV